MKCITTVALGHLFSTAEQLKFRYKFEATGLPMDQTALDFISKLAFSHLSSNRLASSRITGVILVNIGDG